VAIGAKKVQSSKKSSSHPQTNTGKRVANSSNNKKYKKSKHSELSNETSEFLRQVSQGKNAEVSPAAKEVFQRTVNLYRQGVTISPVQENNNQVSFSTSEDDDSNADSESHSSSSSCGSDEMTLDEAYIRDSRDIHGDIDSDIDLEVLDKVQDDWDFEEFSELQDGIGRDSTDSFKNDYVRKLKVQGGLHVHYSAAIQSMLQGDRMESKIFFLFITKSYFDVVRKWTLANARSSTRSRRLPKKGISESLFYAYVGLELGMSFCQYNRIEEFWSKAIFTGHPTFKETMSRNVFQCIRSSITLRDLSSYDHDSASSDPLWHSRSLLEHFLKNCATVATPIGPSALDENTARTKARTKAKTYNANKPCKWGIRFYAVNGAVIPYLSSFFDNRAGNTTGRSGAEDYCTVFRSLRTPYNRIFSAENDFNIPVHSPTSLWVLQMAHQTQSMGDPNGRRIFFTDNFYTSHRLSKALKTFTDGEARLIGTIRMKTVDCTNRFHLFKAIDMIDRLPRGSWALVRAYDQSEDLSRLQREHQQLNRDRSKGERTEFVPPFDRIADSAGYIVFKDAKVVVFYTNDLKGTPSSPILEGSSNEAAGTWACVATSLGRK
jgi:hypothetical protein